MHVGNGASTQIISAALHLCDFPAICPTFSALGCGAGRDGLNVTLFFFLAYNRSHQWMASGAGNKMGRVFSITKMSWNSGWRLTLAEANFYLLLKIPSKLGEALGKLSWISPFVYKLDVHNLFYAFLMLGLSIFWSRWRYLLYVQYLYPALSNASISANGLLLVKIAMLKL